MKIEVIDTLDGFNSLKEEWRILEQSLSGKTPYQSWDWLNAWLHEQQPKIRLYTLSVRDAEGCLVGLAPFQREPVIVPGFYVLAFVGQESSISPDFILGPGVEKEVIESLLGFIGRQSSILGMVIKSVAYDYSSCSILGGILESSSASWKAEVFTETTSLKLPVSYDEFLSGLNSKMRQEMRAARRKLEQGRTLGFAVVDAAENCGANLEELLTLNDMRWGQSGGRTVYETIYRSLLHAGMLRIFVLRVDGQPAAALSALVSGKALFAELAGFDYEIESRHLGKYFYGKVIEWAIDNGFSVLDLSSGDESYKRRLKPEAYPKNRIVFASSPIRFRLVQFVRYIGQRVRWLRVASLL